MTAQCEIATQEAAGAPMSLFERGLSLWIALCIICGVVLGQLAPAPCTAMVFVWSRLSDGNPLLHPEPGGTERVLIEIPAMFLVVRVVNRTKGWYERGLAA